MPLTVYWFLSKIRVLPNFEGVDPGTYITFGVTLWFLFSGCVQTPIQVFSNATQTSMQTSFPLSASLVSGYANLLFETCIRFSAVVIIILASSQNLNMHAFFLPILLLPGLLFFISIGIFLAVANIIYRDVSRIVSVSLQYGIFISGVIFPFTGIEILELINQINPFAVFIDAGREWVFGNALNQPKSFIIFQSSQLSSFFHLCGCFM